MENNSQLTVTKKYVNFFNELRFKWYDRFMAKIKTTQTYVRERLLTTITQDFETYHNKDATKRHKYHIDMFTSSEIVTLIISQELSGVSKNGIPWTRIQNVEKYIFSARVRKGSKNRTFNIYHWKKLTHRRTTFSNISSGEHLSKFEIMLSSMLSGYSVEHSFYPENKYSENEQTLSPYFIVENPEENNTKVHTVAEKIKQLEQYVTKNIIQLYENYFGKNQLPQIENNFEKLFTLCYPVLIQFYEQNPEIIINPLYDKNERKAYRQKTIQETTQTIFGKRKYRKDLVKAVAAAPPNIVSFYANFKNVVPIDWIINGLTISKNKSFSQQRSFHLSANENLPALFERLTQNSKRNLVNDAGSLGHTVSYLYADTLLSFSQIQKFELERKKTYLHKDDLKVKTWKELHDKLSVIYRTVQYENEEIIQTEQAQKLEKVFTPEDTYQIHAAKTTHELISWGNEMNNCIASYRRSAVKGHTLLAKLTKNGKMIANIEISDNDCRQLFGKNNQPLETEDHNYVITKLKENNIIAKSESDNYVRQF